MNFKYLYTSAIVGGALFFAGCVTPSFMPKSDAEKLVATPTATVLERSAEINEIVNEQKLIVALTSETINFYGEIPEILANRLSHIGTTDVALIYENQYFNSSKYQEMLQNLVTSCNEKNINVWLQLSLSDATWTRSSNYLVRKIIHPADAVIGDLADSVLKYQGKHPTAQLSGIIFDFNVDFFYAGNPKLPTGQLYNWSSASWGIGQDNDLIIQMGVKTIAELKEALPTTEFSIRVPVEALEKAQAGELTNSSINDFLAIAPQVIINISENSSGKYVARYNDIVKSIDNQADNQVLLSLTLASHIENADQALRRRSFEQFMLGLKAVVTGCDKNSAFGGVLITPFSSLEDIIEKN